MPYELLLSLLLFAFASSITPGPNNMMILASGANFGFRRSLPHILGISLGHSLMVFLVGLGVGQIFQLWPPAYTLLKIGAVLYMLYLAWKIAGAAPPEGRGGAGRPFTFLQAAAFQWVNPKAWTMALGAVTAYAPDKSAWSYALVAAAFLTVNLPSVAFWAVLGQEMRRFLTSARRLRIFNGTMAVLLIASLWPVLRH